MTIISAIQMNAGTDVAANLAQAATLIADAAADGAELIVLPEMFSQMGVAEKDKLAICESSSNGPLQDFIKQQAKKHRVWLVAGTIPFCSNDENRMRAACLIVNSDGEVVARYDKIHLFDAQLTEHQEEYRESDYTEPGNQVVVIDSPVGRIGIAVCYDMRFPELFTELRHRGVEVIVIPAAFTYVTGEAHWEILLRARAIDCFCYVVGAGQVGQHGKRRTYGHSMIVEPWGSVMQSLTDKIGFVNAAIDLEHLRRIRRNMPVYEHRQQRGADLKG